MILFIALLTSSSYGTALKAIREDQIAAESMGVSLYFHKMLAFMLSAFIAAVGGGLLASYNGTIGPDMFRVAQTYNVLMIVVMGGMGSITGSIVGAFIVTIGQEYLRVLDGPINLGFWSTDGISGMRMVVFLAILLLIIVFFRNGLFGTKEFSWSAIDRRLRKMSGHGEVKEGMMRAVLEVNQATMQFGGLIAVNNLSMTIGNNEIVALIGPNGAGKSTTLRAISGLERAQSGKIIYNG